VNFASVARSDYVRNAARRLLVPGMLAELDTREILRRMEALRFCIRTIPPSRDTVASTELWLVSARAVSDWSTRADRASTSLSGSGYVFIFALRVGDPMTTRDPRRLRWRVKQVTTCHIADALLCWRVGDGSVREVTRPSFEGVVADFPAAIVHRNPR
jgi:hypothetical protein